MSNPTPEDATAALDDLLAECSLYGVNALSMVDMIRDYLNAGEVLTEAELDEIKAESWQEGFDEGAMGAADAASDLWRNMVHHLQKSGHLGDCGSEGEEGMFTCDDIMQAYFDQVRERQDAPQTKEPTND